MAYQGNDYMIIVLVRLEILYFCFHHIFCPDFWKFSLVDVWFCPEVVCTLPLLAITDVSYQSMLGDRQSCIHCLSFWCRFCMLFTSNSWILVTFKLYVKILATFPLAVRNWFSVLGLLASWPPEIGARALLTQHKIDSASIGQWYQGFLRKRAGSSFGKKGNLHCTRENLKNGPNFTPLRVNKMFSLKF
jgi:hypothetical protein